MNLAQYILILALRVYRAAVSPMLAALFGPLGLGCRFHPTCSQYALEAVQRHGATRGLFLSVRRLCRCHPWGGCGDDPVPRAGNVKTVEALKREALKREPEHHASTLERFNASTVRITRSHAPTTLNDPCHGS